MKLRNHTDIPNEIIKQVVRFARPPGIARFFVVVKPSVYTYAGNGCSRGIVLRIKADAKYPRILRTYQLGQLRGRRYWLGSVIEALIYLTAHELMHTKQGQSGQIYGRRGRRVGYVRGRVHGARGRYSEIETESWAIKKLREWRRLH